MEYLNQLLPIIIYILLIVLIILLIIIAVKAIKAMNKAQEVIDNVDKKVKTLDGIFNAIDAATDKISLFGDKVYGAVSGLVEKIFKSKKKEDKEESKDE